MTQKATALNNEEQLPAFHRLHQAPFYIKHLVEMNLFIVKVVWTVQMARSKRLAVIHHSCEVLKFEA